MAPKARRPRTSTSPTRGEVELLRRMLAELEQRVEKAEEERRIQFKRMAQIQAEVDELKRSVGKSVTV